MMQKVATIDDYIAGFPANVQVILKQLRATIHQAAPEAVEKIGYGIPTFALHGNLVHFAVYKNHIGLYPGSRTIEKFSSELAKFETSKGAIRFPLDTPIPFDLIERIVKERIEENLLAAETKRKKKNISP
jgi:uncharacterized protein YdhG (YjbR/CyaY superfamily)